MLFLNTILDIIFPRYCLSCNKVGTDLCENCLSTFPSAERETENWIFPLFDYRHPPVKKAVKFIKYKGKKKLLETFAEILYGAMIEELAELQIMENFQEPILIPIPLSKRRYRERGFNQAELLARKILKNDEQKYFKIETRVLVKTKETEHQANIKDRSVRLRNLANSFTVINSDLIKGRNIILIDDVTTTGATLKEAKKVLKKSGAKKIIAFTLAH